MNKTAIILGCAIAVILLGLAIAQHQNIIQVFQPKTDLEIISVTEAEKKLQITYRNNRPCPEEITDNDRIEITEYRIWNGTEPQNWKRIARYGYSPVDPQQNANAYISDFFLYYLSNQTSNYIQLKGRIVSTEEIVLSNKYILPLPSPKPKLYYDNFRIVKVRLYDYPHTNDVLQIYYESYGYFDVRVETLTFKVGNRTLDLLEPWKITSLSCSEWVENFCVTLNAGEEVEVGQELTIYINGHYVGTETIERT